MPSCIAQYREVWDPPSGSRKKSLAKGIMRNWCHRSILRHSSVQTTPGTKRRAKVFGWRHSLGGQGVHYFSGKCTKINLRWHDLICGSHNWALSDPQQHVWTTIDVVSGHQQSENLLLDGHWLHFFRFSAETWWNEIHWSPAWEILAFWF